MAKFAATDVYVKIDGTIISDWCFNVETPDSKEQIDVSGFNSTGSSEYVPGKREQSIALGVLQDFGGGGSTAIHTLLTGLYTTSSAFPFEIRPTSGSVSSTNPKFSGTAQLYDYPGLTAPLNNRVEINVTLHPSSNAVWAWATA